MNVREKHQISTTAKKELLLLAIMIVFSIIMTIVMPRFMTVSNMLNILKDIAIIGTLAMGMTFVLITGGIDLSAGYNVTLGMVVAGLVFTNTSNVVLAIVATFAITMAIALANGLIITKMKIVPFIATLATMSVAQGLVQFFGKGKTLSLSSPVFTFIGQTKVFSVPLPAIIMLIVLLIGGILLKYTKLGNYTYAIGCNAAHARSAGISVNRCLMLVYAIEGLCAGIGAILLGCKVSIISLNAGGSSLLMDTIAAVVLGGTSTSGGEGRMRGTLLGVIFIGFITNALTLLNVSTVAQDLFKGIVIILAIILNSTAAHIRLRKAA